MKSLKIFDMWRYDSQSNADYTALFLKSDKNFLIRKDTLTLTAKLNHQAKTLQLVSVRVQTIYFLEETHTVRKRRNETNYFASEPPIL